MAEEGVHEFELARLCLSNCARSKGKPARERQLAREAGREGRGSVSPRLPCCAGAAFAVLAAARAALFYAVASSRTPRVAPLG
jgi:hypothetical protein